MKQKTIYISDELFEWLKDEDNASQVIERLLREHHFNKKEKSIYEDKDIEQLQKLLELEIKKEEIEKQIKEVNKDDINKER